MSMRNNRLPLRWMGLTLTLVTMLLVNPSMALSRKGGRRLLSIDDMDLPDGVFADPFAASAAVSSSASSIASVNGIPCIERTAFPTASPAPSASISPSAFPSESPAPSDSFSPSGAPSISLAPSISIAPTSKSKSKSTKAPSQGKKTSTKAPSQGKKTSTKAPSQGKKTSTKAPSQGKKTSTKAPSQGKKTSTKAPSASKSTKAPSASKSSSRESSLLFCDQIPTEDDCNDIGAGNGPTTDPSTIYSDDFQLVFNGTETDAKTVEAELGPFLQRSLTEALVFGCDGSTEPPDGYIITNVVVTVTTDNDANLTACEATSKDTSCTGVTVVVVVHYTGDDTSGLEEWVNDVIKDLCPFEDVTGLVGVYPSCDAIGFTSDDGDDTGGNDGDDTGGNDGDDTDGNDGDDTDGNEGDGTDGNEGDGTRTEEDCNEIAGGNGPTSDPSADYFVPILFVVDETSDIMLSRLKDFFQNVLSRAVVPGCGSDRRRLVEATVTNIVFDVQEDENADVGKCEDSLTDADADHTCLGVIVQAKVYYTGEDTSNLKQQLDAAILALCGAMKNDVQGVVEVYTPCSSIVFTPGDGDDTDIIGIDTERGTSNSGLRAGGKVGIAIGGLILALLLLLLVRRRRKRSNTVEDVKHVELDDDAEQETYLKDIDGDGSSYTGSMRDSGDASPRAAHVVGEADSVYSGWTGYTADGASGGGANGNLGEGHLGQDVHICSSATCEICEQRRQTGATGVDFIPTDMSHSASLPENATRDYISKDTVDL